MYFFSSLCTKCIIHSLIVFCCFQRQTKMFSGAKKEKAESHEEDQHLHRLIHHLLRSLCNYKVSRTDNSLQNSRATIDCVVSAEGRPIGGLRHHVKTCRTINTRREILTFGWKEERHQQGKSVCVTSEQHLSCLPSAFRWSVSDGKSVICLPFSNFMLSLYFCFPIVSRSWSTVYIHFG